MQYKKEENINEKKINLYSETSHSLLRNINHATTNMNLKFINMYYNDTEATKIKKLIKCFVHLKLSKFKFRYKNAIEGVTKSVNICDLNYKNYIIQDNTKEP